MSSYLPSFSAPPSRPGSLAASRPNSYYTPSRASFSRPGSPVLGSPYASRPGTSRGPSRAPSLSRPASPIIDETDETTPDILSVAEAEKEIQRDEKGNPIVGRIVGGKYASPENESIDPECGAITTVDIDMPLTLTEVVCHNDKEYVVLNFATGDKENPYEWSKWKKAMVSTMLNLMTLFIGLATTAYSSGISSMVKDLNASTEQGQLGLFTFNIACAIAPMVLAPFCELVGRKVIYAGAFFCFTILFIGLALAQTIGTIIGLRLLLGLFGCVGTILVGGTFDDMYVPHERSRPMAMFSWVAIFGTVAAPIYAGFIDQSIGWRWIEGIQGLANVPLLIAIFLFFPETRGGVALHKRASALRKATGDERYVAEGDIYTPDVKSMLKASSVKAIHMLATEPVVLAFGLWIAFCWGVAFLFLSVISITFADKRGWSTGMAGLPYIALALGTTLAWMAHHLQMRKYDRMIADPNVKVTPEARLYGAMYGAIWLPVGLFIYSFTQYAFLNWVGPCIGLVLIAFGIYFVFESTYSYTADCYGESASSAIAGQGLMRNTLGAVTPLFATQFFVNVGSQYAGLILALFGTALSLIPFVFMKWGPQLRARSKLAKVYE
ncbi:fructose facilitator [Coniella lustricola]|uniref:Fructose facilitator n=1 Tax=Coniella lustricola TaxID=2025994 RepID=A0A2T3AB41_9PEZI|nr:fructose facilitator [Coniella lustricola]